MNKKLNIVIFLIVMIFVFGIFFNLKSYSDKISPLRVEALSHCLSMNYTSVFFYNGFFELPRDFDYYCKAWVYEECDVLPDCKPTSYKRIVSKDYRWGDKE